MVRELELVSGPVVKSFQVSGIPKLAPEGELVTYQGTTLTFAATCPIGQVRFIFHLPYSNFHLPLKNCMFYNVSFKTK